jgi:hypothetical protein
LGDWFAYGLFWGASLLANASLGSLFFPWLAWAAIRQSKQDKTFTLTAKSVASRWWQGPALAATVAVLCCVPWTVRNYLQFHRLIPLRSSFSFELWSGNNNIFDPHTGNAMARITLYGEVRQYTQLGESGYMQDKWRKTTLFIRTHPQLELRLLLARVISTWLGTQHPITDFIDTDSWLVRLVFLTNCLLLLGTLGGIFFLYRRRHPLTFPIAITPIIFPIVYYITHTSLRYRHPLDPMLILLTAMSIAALFRITNLESARE